MSKSTRRIGIDLSEKEWERVKSHPAYPQKQWGEKTVLAFYHAVFFEGLEAPRFQRQESEQRLRRAEARLSNAEFAVKQLQAKKP